MKLTSSAFSEGTRIPAKYSCDGENVSPPLAIEGVPPEAQSLVLLMDDPDIPDFVKEKYGIEEFDHWVCFNIAPNKTQISEGEEPGTLGNNTSGNAAYTGPCPPDREHRYFFKLFALDCDLDLPEGCSKHDVLDAIDGHILAEATLMGRYERA